MSNLAAALIIITIGAALMWALWPGPAHATRLLTRWGVAEPTEPELEAALRYLKRRRLAYPPLYMAIMAGESLHLLETSPLLPTLLAVLLVGGLIAEAIGRRPWRTSPEGTSQPPRLFAVVPPWSIALASVLLAGVGTLWAGAQAGSSWAPETMSAGGVGLVVAAIGAVTVWLALRPGPELPPRADRALRMRSARVGSGLAMAALGLSTAPGSSFAGLVLSLLGLAGWVAITLPVPPTRVSRSDAR